MKRIIQNIFITLFIVQISCIQAQKINGRFDDFQDLVSLIEVPFTMPDGTELMTNIYLPVTRDSLVIDFEMTGFGTVSLEVIQKGVQYIIYDSINGDVNENPYQLPVIFTRTPYDKNSNGDIETLFALLGYAYAIQDTRGRYASEGVYLPLYSDAWNKNPYHPNIGHIMDITDLSDPINGNKHEDGINSINFLLDSLYRIYQSDTFKTCNGAIGMIGASALGNTQYQAASAQKINPDEPGLKCLFPIVATNENYHSTGFHNGVYRQSLINGWLEGQIEDLDEDLIDIDTSLSNNIHTPADYGLNTIQDVLKLAINHFTVYSYNGLSPAYFPNSIIRQDFDASMAAVNEFGEGDSLGQYSRYTNMELPIYHLTGWWDIFINGQIDTYNFLMKNISDDYDHKSLQKLIIGPWAHQTVGQQTTGDITYKKNVNDFIIDFGNIVGQNGSIAMNQLLNTDIMQWFRYNLNNATNINVGEPKVILTESDRWQNLTDVMEIRFPSSDYIISFNEFINFLGGESGLPEMEMELRVIDTVTTNYFDIPPLDEPMLDLDEPLNSNELTNFKDIPNVRFYVPGPIEDGIPENEFAGNYWMERDSFPFINDIVQTKIFLHANGIIDQAKPETDEGHRSYLTDPDDPVITVGGANMIVENPNGIGKSQGQIDLANPDYAPFTMNREGVISFESAEIEDSLSIIGIPVATLYTSCEPVDSTLKYTDTDYFVRILDVYPDVRELFVVGGAVNARAREYAKSLVNGIDNINIPFENIKINRIYEYKFKLLPIAYTFGKGHKIKILISSSNYPRYQVNPNIPINNNEFFRREPGDEQTYNYDGVDITPRTVMHKIAFSEAYPTHIDFPVYGNNQISSSQESHAVTQYPHFTLFPNPMNDYVTCISDSKEEFCIEIYEVTGKLIRRSGYHLKHKLSINLNPGVYIINIKTKDQKYLITKKLVVQ